MGTIPTAIRINLTGVTAEADFLLQQRLMRPQQAAMRIAYNRSVEGLNDKDIWNNLRGLFPYLTGRNINDAITLAQATIESQKALLPVRIAGLERRLERAEKNLERESSRRNGPRPERVKAVQLLIQRLAAERDELQAHLDKGTLPPAIFGGRKLWNKLPDSRQEWRSRRSSLFYSRGARENKGNAHCRLVIGAGGTLQLSVRIPAALKQRGAQMTTGARWLTFDIEYSRSQDAHLRQAALAGAAQTGTYDVRLIRLAPGSYRAYVTICETVQGNEYSFKELLPESVQILGGIDLNLDHLAVVITDRQGQYRKNRIFHYHNLGELRREKTDWLIGNIAHDVIEWLIEQGGQGMVIEDLNISDRGNGGSHFNRRTVPFAYRQLTEMLVRRALRKGLLVKRVNPAYTSWIGKLKYASQYGISRHVAAAYVIGRRGLGLQERLPKRLLVCFPQIADGVRADIARLNLALEKTKANRNKLTKQLKTRREWLQRLENYQDYLPEKEHPWLLWVTLYLIDKNISETRDGQLPIEGTTRPVGLVTRITSGSTLYLNREGLPSEDVGTVSGDKPGDTPGRGTRPSALQDA